MPALDPTLEPALKPGAPAAMPATLDTRHLPPLTVRGRVVHALSFEIVAAVLCAPFVSMAVGAGTFRSGVLMVAVSLVAMSWNMLFNIAFDRAQRRLGFARGAAARVVHAVLFEAGLMLATVPLAAWWLDIGLWQAFWLDVGILLFFLPYTVIFNWAFDRLRVVLLQRQAAR